MRARLKNTICATCVAWAATASAQQTAPQTGTPSLTTLNPALYGRGTQRNGQALSSSLLFDDRSTISEMRFAPDGHMFTFRQTIKGIIAISGSCSNRANPVLSVEGVQTRIPQGNGPLGLYVDNANVRTTFEIDAAAPSTSMGIYTLQAAGVPEFVRLLGGLPYGRIVTIGMVRDDKTNVITQYVAPGAVTAHQLMFAAPPANVELLKTVDSLCQTLIGR